VLLKWNTQRGVPVIPKSSSEAHLRENLEGMTAWKLSYPQKEVLDKMDCGRWVCWLGWCWLGWSWVLVRG
jgi:D-xylose reductase